MIINKVIEGNKATLTLSGKITVQTAHELEEVIDSLPVSACFLVIDLTDIEYVSSAGLRVLVSADKLVSRRGGSLTLLHPSKDVLNVFEMTGLVGLFAIEQ